jgi:DHA2 family multidrug resistance protein
MLVAGRLTSRMDPRLLMAFGIALLSYSLYEQTGWTPDVSSWTVIVNTIIQGAGLGLVYIPLQVIAFATLAPELRTDATSLLSLVRNVGSAIGVSATSALLARNIQISHADLAANMTPFNPIARGVGATGRMLDPASPKGAAMLDVLINQQAAIIAYLNDFKAMLIVSAPAVLLLLLMRRPSHSAAPDPAHAAMD